MPYNVLHLILSFSFINQLIKSNMPLDTIRNVVSKSTTVLQCQKVFVCSRRSPVRHPGEWVENKSLLLLMTQSVQFSGERSFFLMLWSFNCYFNYPEFTFIFICELSEATLLSLWKLFHFFLHSIQSPSSFFPPKFYSYKVKIELRKKFSSFRGKKF